MCSVTNLIFQQGSTHVCLLTNTITIPNSLSRAINLGLNVCVCVCVCVRACVRACVCVCVCVWVERLDVMVMVSSSQPSIDTGSFDSHLGFAVVTLSKSLYPHYSSIPSSKIGTWLWLGWQKGRNYPSHRQSHDVAGSRLDFGCQHHTSGTVNEFLQVPSLAPGNKPNMLVHCASANCPEGQSPYGLGGVIMLVAVLSAIVAIWHGCVCLCVYACMRIMCM